MDLKTDIKRGKHMGEWKTVGKQIKTVKKQIFKQTYR